MIFEFGNIKLDIDVEKTKNFFDNFDYKEHSCNCSGCRNYYKSAEEMDRDILDFFNKLGLDILKPTELLIPFPEDDKLRYYGWYHICGKILEGESPFENTELEPMILNNSQLEEDSEILVLPGTKLEEDTMYPIVKDYLVGFSEDELMLEENFPQPVIQMEISALIPWC